MNASQQIFVVFFAIFWGTSANAWPRWKPFHWTFFGSSSRVTTRVLWATLLLNVVPVVYFAWMLQQLAAVGTQAPDTRTIVVGLIPAFAIFGLYRLWFSVIEMIPRAFYYRDDADMTKAGKKYLVGVDPTMEGLHLTNSWWWWINVSLIRFRGRFNYAA